MTEALQDAAADFTEVTVLALQDADFVTVSWILMVVAFVMVEAGWVETMVEITGGWVT